MIESSRHPHANQDLPADIVEQSMWTRCVRDVKARVASVGIGQLSKVVRLPPQPGVGVLAYHRVHPRVGGLPLNVTPECFHRQLAGLLKRGFTPVGLTELARAHREGNTLPGKSFAVTFDDGYENNFLYALPVLQKLNIPATIFLATAYLDSDQPFPFDAWRHAGANHTPASAWRSLTTGQCERLLNTGLIDLGAHTHLHVDYRNSPGEFHRDLVSCSRELKHRFGIDDPTFSYPFGFVNGRMAQVVSDVGMSCGLTTESQLVTQQSDRFQWGRLGVAEYDTADSLAAKLSGWYSVARNRWRRWAYGEQPASVSNPTEANS